MNSAGQQIAWLQERDFGIFKAITRQFYRTHRPFTVDLIDLEGQILMTIHRPFSFINSHIKAILPGIQNGDHREGLIIGESIQNWHLWRRRYNLFDSMGDNQYVQFGKIDAGFLQWEFGVENEQGQISGAVSRNFVGLFREFMTDTGVYVVRMDPSSFYGLDDIYSNVAPVGMNLDQKAVMLANAVSIDFDYFSRKSGGPGLMPIGGSGDWS
ncbi:unnamed protein product [Ambrosiozyma monospora]|uniref:Phospholipid scramblase n=1 Tax=Ambrosiozyma monospora TaxID=43982 RepID=A0A9W6Z411_AMBMO|nr:unnamed protein product [Ambrosiozyma monospora]